MSGQSLWAANALWAGPAIRDRLVDQVPALREVLVMDEIDANGPGPKQFPAALVLLHAMRPTGNATPGATKVTLEQDWMVAVAVRSMRPEADRNSAAAGPVIPAVITALQGWVPDGQPRALAWRPGPTVNYGRDITYYPFIFTLQAVSA